MPEEKMLSGEEITQLRDLNKKYSDTIASLGEAEIKINLLKDKLTELENEKKLLLSDYSTIKQQETDITEKLLAKYGEGKVDLDSGKIEVL